jgi:hypothetical protein
LASFNKKLAQPAFNQQLLYSSATGAEHELVAISIRVDSYSDEPRRNHQQADHNYCHRTEEAMQHAK